MAEQAPLYLYEPGKRGIDFSWLPTDRLPERPFFNVQRGESPDSSFFHITVASDCLELFPMAELVRYRMRADVHDHPLVLDAKVLSFELMTRSEAGPHPDLYAGQFVKAAITFFSGFYAIEACLDEWHEGSHNYGVYMSSLGTTAHTRVEAALQTWSGLTYAKHGFGHVNPAEIKDINHPQDGRRIEVLFRKSA